MDTLITQIDQITKKFVNSFAPLNGEQLNWKPGSGTWSIAQNIEHLIIVNESYYPVIESIRHIDYTPPFISKLNFIVSLFGKIILKSVSPERHRKTKTFPIWEPAVSEISPDILKRFENHQEALKKIVTNSIDLISNGIIISSPANKNVVYKLETAFEIIVNHEQRHYNQAKEVLDKLP